MRSRLILLIALALLAPACSAFGEAPAATVDGREIPTDAVSDEVATIQANQLYIDALEESYGKPVVGDGTFDAAFAAQLLTVDVYYDIIEHDLARRNVPIADEAIDAARAQIEGQLPPEVLSEFPEAFVTELIHRSALFGTVQQEIVDSIGDDERAFYDDNPDDFAEICLSHALVGVQGGRTPAEANAEAQDLYDRIQAGDDFDDIATNESDDTVAAADGGSLGCGSQLSLQFDPVFEAAAFALEEGVVSEPVETQFGAHLILVTSRDVPSYREVADQVPQVMQAAQQTRLNEYFARTFCAAEVSVNPRYGRWTGSVCDGAVPGRPQVEPPEGPIGSTDTTSLLGP